MGWFGLSPKERLIWRSIRPGNKIKISLKDEPNDVYITNVIEREDSCIKVQTPVIGTAFLEIVPKTAVQMEIEVFNPVHGRIKFYSIVIGQEWAKERIMQIAAPKSLQWVQLRKFFRLEVVLDAEYSPVEKRVPLKMLELGYPVNFSLLKNISEGGALLITDKMIDNGLGSVINLRIQIGHGTCVRARAKVVRVEKTPAQGKFGIGVEFLYVREEDRDVLRRFIQTTGREQFLMS